MNSGFEYREIVGPGSAGLALLDHLARSYRHSSADEWRARIAAGRVLVDGRAAGAEALLRRGQTVVWNRPPWNEPEAPLAWALLHRDEDLLAVAKPAGLPTLPGGGFLEHTLLALVRRLDPGAAPVHRLDRGASGVVLFARSARARDRLAEDFRAGRIDKEYRALVTGSPSQDAFAVATPIGRVAHPSLGIVHAAAGRAPRAARTMIEVLERRGDTTLLAIRPVTGRPHQIRIHLAAAGHPLVGEPLYVAGGLPAGAATHPGQGGFMLHASRLVLRHPSSGASLELWCAPPPALRRRREH
jgi:23S rRNA pseudouridine1911/1915/1917 synthase